MDVMSLRRGIIEAMAKGAEVFKGTFTVPTEGGSYIFQLPKTLSSYIAIFEMDDASKSALVASGQSGARVFFWQIIYPERQINNTNNTYDTLTNRYNSATGELSGNSIATTETDSRISFSIGAAFSAGVNYLYYGMTYKYVVISLEGIL